MPTRLLLAVAAVHALHAPHRPAPAPCRPAPAPRRPAPAPAAVGRRAALAAATLILPKRATAEEAKNEVAPGTDEFLAAAGLKKKTVLNAAIRNTLHFPQTCIAVLPSIWITTGPAKFSATAEAMTTARAIATAVVKSAPRR